MKLAHPFAFAIALALWTAGCTTGPYVRSDLFLDAKKVSSIFVMPVATEVTLDESSRLDRNRLKSGLQTSRTRIKEVLDAELTRRGYSITGFCKDFDKLEESAPNERILREAVQVFVASASSQKTTEQLVGIIQSILANPKADGEASRTNTVEQASQPLVSRSREARGAYPTTTDSVLYVFVKSHVARRSFFGHPTKDSTLYIKMELVYLSEQKLVFSSAEQFPEADLLDASSLKQSLSKALSKIPVRLD